MWHTSTVGEALALTISSGLGITRQVAAARWTSALDAAQVIVEVAKAVTYIGLALLVIAVVSWAFVTSGGTNWEWTQAIVFVFSLAMLAAIVALVIVLFLG